MTEDRWLSLFEVRSSLKDAFQDRSFGRRLVLVTASLMRKKTFHALPLASLFEPLDFVHTVIVKVLSGERRLPAKPPSRFISSLISCIESEISNTVTLKESSYTGTIDLISGPINAGHEIAEVVEPKRSTEDTLQQCERQNEILALFNKIDPKMETLAKLAMVDGIHGRKDFAVALGISEREITNIKKRMQRIYLDHIKRASRGKEHYV